jgi:MFS family permease
MRPTRVRYWVIVFAATLAVITYVDRVCISFAAPAMQSDLGLSAVEMGWAFWAFGVAYSALEIPVGFLGDWAGPRRVLLFIAPWWSFFTAATAWVWNLPSLLVARALFGAGEAGGFPNLAKTLATWLPEGERARAQGIMWLSARWGGAFTPPLVALVMLRVGWRHGLELFGCLGAVWAAFFYHWYRDNPLDNPKLNEAERELLRPSARLAAGHVHVPWGRLLVSRQVWMLCLQYFTAGWGWYFYITWLPTYLRDERHLAIGSRAMLGILPLFLGGLGNPVGAFAVGRLTPVLGVAWARRTVSSVGFAGAACALFLSTRMNNPLLAMLAISAAAFGNDLNMASAWAAAMDVGGRCAGTVAGAMNMFGNGGGTLSPLAIPYILRWTNNNWNLTFYVSAAIYATGVIFWLLLDPVTPLEGTREPL